jgi:hypothetical protein
MLVLKELSKEVAVTAKDQKEISRHFNSFVAETIAHISFGDLLEKLGQYPRRFKARKPNESEFD